MHPQDLNACPTSRARLISCISTYPQQVLVAHAQLLPAVHIRVRPDMPALLQRLLLYARFLLLNSLLLRPPRQWPIAACILAWSALGGPPCTGGTSMRLGEPSRLWENLRATVTCGGGVCDAHLILCLAGYPIRACMRGGSQGIYPNTPTLYPISQCAFSGLHALRGCPAGVGRLRPCAGSSGTCLTGSAQSDGVGGQI